MSRHKETYHKAKDTYHKAVQSAYSTGKVTSPASYRARTEKYTVTLLHRAEFCARNCALCGKVRAQDSARCGKVTAAPMCVLQKTFTEHT